MLYKILALLAMVPGSFMVYWFTHLVVPIRKPMEYSVLSTVGACSCWLFNQIVLPAPSVLLELAVFPVAMTILMFYTEQRLRGVIASAVLHLGQIIGAVVCMYGIVYILHVDIAEQMLPGSLGFILASAVTSGLSVLAEYGAVCLLRRLPEGMDLNARYLWFASIPASQMLLLDVASRPAFDLGQYTGMRLSVLLGMVMCAAADVACVLVYRKLRQLENLKIRVNQVEQSLDEQTAYYEHLQKQILSVNCIRHDLNNQLQAARYLLEKGDARQVSEQLDMLENAVRDRVGPRYCENLVADAVLSMKAEECRKENITLDAEIFLPLDLPIRNAHLCSIFSNLLDNSIHGIRETKQTGGTIRIRSDVQKKYLTISCSNPALPPEKKSSRDVLRKHGLGLEILEHLAGMYRGSMNTRYEGGRFTVTICLSTEA